MLFLVNAKKHSRTSPAVS